MVSVWKDGKICSGKRGVDDGRNNPLSNRPISPSFLLYPLFYFFKIYLFILDRESDRWEGHSAKQEGEEESPADSR